MKRTVTALVAATTLAVAAVATPNTADARRGWWGPGLIGGLAAGAIIGSALARPYYGYPYGYYSYYRPAPVYYSYYAPAPVYYGAYGAWPYRGCVRYRYGYRYR